MGAGYFVAATALSMVVLSTVDGNLLSRRHTRPPPPTHTTTTATHTTISPTHSPHTRSMAALVRTSSVAQGGAKATVEQLFAKAQSALAVVSPAG